MSKHTPGSWTYEPVKVDYLCEIVDRGCVCGMTFDAAVAYAKEAFGEDAAVVREHDDFAYDVVWYYGDKEVEPVILEVKIANVSDATTKAEGK